MAYGDYARLSYVCFRPSEMTQELKINAAQLAVSWEQLITNMMPD